MNGGYIPLCPEMHRVDGGSMGVRPLPCVRDELGIAVMIFAQFALNFAQFLWKLEHWRDVLYEEQDIEV